MAETNSQTDSKSKAGKKKVVAAKVSAVKKGVKTTAPKESHAHPTYNDMIIEAISNLKERSGSSRQAILKYIKANFEVGDNVKAINAHLKLALKRSVENHLIKHAKGSGATGSFRIGEKTATHAETHAKKPVVAKSPKPKQKVVKTVASSKKTKQPSTKSNATTKPKTSTKSIAKTKKVSKAQSPKKTTKKSKAAKKRK